MTERTSMPSCRSSSKRRSFKYLERGLDRIKQKFNKNSESCDNGRVHPDFVGLPVPTPPTATPAATNFAATTVNAPFPTPTPPSPQGWWTPGQHDHEASGSNHTSQQNSEYFDPADTQEYLNQHVIPNHSDLYCRQGNHQPGHQPRIEDQLAYSLQDMLLSTSPTSHDNNRVHPDFVGLPVPTPPTATFAATNFHAPFPTPTPPSSQGWWTPGQHDHEASGSNHTSQQNSEYFDPADTQEYLNQHVIPNHSDLYCRQGNHQPGHQPRIEDQLAYSLQDMLLSTSPTSHDNNRVHPDFVGLPVPTPPTATSAATNFHAPFSTPTLPLSQGWWTPGQHDYEASGSNHTSQQNSEYFDPADTQEYLNQHVIPNYSDLYSRPGNYQPRIEDQLANSLQDMLLTTSPTSHDQNYNPNSFDQSFVSELEPVSAYCDPLNEHCFSDGSWCLGSENATTTSAQQPHGQGTMDESWYLGSDYTTTTSAQQPQPQPHGYGSMSMATGDTVDSGYSTMDTGASPYILQPVAEERPSSMKRKFYNFYTDLRGIVRGEEISDGSGRRGRSIRVMGRIVCIAVRLKERRKLRKKSKKSVNKRIHEPKREQGTRKKRTGASTASNTECRYKGVAERKGKWSAEVRVSMVSRMKVWAGTYESQREAALAADAALYHCTGKNKKYNFPEHMKDLGPSHYKNVCTLCKSGRKVAAEDLVKSLAKAHAAKFGCL